MLVVGDQDDIRFNAAWLREMRDALGWSTMRVAEEAKRAAADFGDEISLSQQLVSRFENGHLKSSPRWLGYVQRAMLEHMAGHSMAPGRVFDLRLPNKLSQFFNGNLSEAIRERFDIEVMSEIPRTPHSKTPPRADMVQVAMLDLAYGMGETFLEDHSDVRQEEFPLAFIRHFTKSRVTDLMIAEGVGDSMAPTIGPNDLVLIDRAAVNLNIDDRVWACAIGQMGMIKRLRGSGDGVTILSDNPLVPDNHAADGELHIIGRVVGTFGRL